LSFINRNSFDDGTMRVNGWG